MNEKSDRQVPGFYRKRLGDVLVTALCDGYLDADIGVLQDISREEIDGRCDPGPLNSAQRHLEVGSDKKWWVLQGIALTVHLTAAGTFRSTERLS